MAWQLIYTSAPRLLEAGRTGFGTVARHRAVGELVAGAVERVSQFARLPGLGARRVIRSHRIITAGASQVHVFSCIRDAGSDYTGRTNHLAHHLIAEPREVKLAAEAGITPADILSQMKWRVTWSEPPRFLEALEEVSLMSLRTRTSASAWELLTGRADSCILPTQTARCFMILPADTDALPLIQESLRQISGESMQVTFSTQLEPTDDVASFRWVALNAGSPLRQQADGIARTVLDLTRPQSLPKIGMIASPAPIRTARESFTPISAPASTVTQVNGPMTGYPSSFMESLHPMPKARPGNFAGVVIAAVLVISAGIAAYFWLSQQPKQQQTGATVDLVGRVDSLWKKHQLALPIAATWLKGTADSGLIESHEKSLRVLFQSLRQPLQATEIPRPESTQDEFMDMLQAYTEWQRAVNDSVRQEIWSRDAAAEIKIEARVRLDQEMRVWKRFALNFKHAPLHPEILKEEIAKQTLKRLTQSTAPDGAPEDWRDILLMTTQPMPKWPEIWLKVRGLPAFPAALSAPDQAILTKAAKDTSAPSWLQQMAAQRLSQIQEMDQTEAEAVKAAQAMLKPTPAELVITPADGPTSNHPRFILLNMAELDFKDALLDLPSLPVQDDMQVLVGSAGFAETNLVRWRALGSAGVYRKSFTESDTIEIKEQRLINASSAQESLRIIGRSSTGSEVLFEVLLLTQKRMPPVVWHYDAAFTFESRLKDQLTTLNANAARWLSHLIFIGSKPSLRLQNLQDPTQRYRVRLEAGIASVEIETKMLNLTVNTARVSAITEEIENLKQGIRTDEQRRAEVAEGNLAKREKEDIQIRAQQAISAKEMRIMEMQEELRGITGLTTTPAPHKKIPAGRYALMAVVFDMAGREKPTRLCELNITSQQAKNEP